MHVHRPLALLSFVILMFTLPISLPADITWNFIFEDVNESTGVGFDDATNGATRQATVRAVTDYLNTVVDFNGTVDLQFLESQNDGNGFLGGASPFFADSGPGFQNGAVFHHATTGNDPFAGVADAQLIFDFGYNWNNGTGPVGNNEFDFYTVALHEIVHTMGFLTLTAADGTSVLTDENPGIYSVYDSFLERGDGRKLFSNNGGATFEGTADDLISDDVFFGGAAATAGNGGDRIEIYAPDNFRPGSSLGHVAINMGEWTMRHTTPRGRSRRTLKEGEIGVLRDIGWVSVPEPNTTIILTLASLTAIAYRVVRSRRPDAGRS